MAESTTLYTFFLQCPNSIQSVQLLGSWDRFQGAYPMVKDAVKGPGHWTGCHTFKNAVLDDPQDEKHTNRGRGLRMGATYWYYYRLNGEIDYFDSVQPVTTSCPTLPGQIVNVLQLARELPLPASSTSQPDSTTYAPKTFDPRGRKQTPARSGVLDIHTTTLRPSKESIPQSHVQDFRPISRAGYAPWAAWGSQGRAHRSSRNNPASETLVDPGSHSTSLRSSDLVLRHPDLRSSSCNASVLFYRSSSQRAQSAPASIRYLVGHWSGSPSGRPTCDENNRVRTSKFCRRSSLSDETPSSKIRGVGCRSPRAQSDHHEPSRYSTLLPDLPPLNLDLCAREPSLNLLDGLYELKPTTPDLEELLTPSLTCSSASPDLSDSPHCSETEQIQEGEPQDVDTPIISTDDTSAASLQLQTALSDCQSYPPVLMIDTTSYDIARTPAYVSSTLLPFQTMGFPDDQPSTQNASLVRFPSIRDHHASPPKWDSGIALTEPSPQSVEDLMSELGYLSGVVA